MEAHRDSPTPVGFDPHEGRAKMLEGLVRVGADRCAYTIPGADWTKVRCDCKFGGPKPSGEQTGCPEIRTAYWLIDAMTDDEFGAARWRWIESLGGIEA